MLYKSKALTTIHITGHTAKVAPFAIEASASPTGNRHEIRGDQERDDQTTERRLPRAANDTEQDEHGDDRQRRHDK